MFGSALLHAREVRSETLPSYYTNSSNHISSTIIITNVINPDNVVLNTIHIINNIATQETWVTELSGKAPYRQMRGFAGEKQPQSGALGTASQQLAS